jgi:hypothetical protein
MTNQSEIQSALQAGIITLSVRRNMSVLQLEKLINYHLITGALLPQSVV